MASPLASHDGAALAAAVAAAVASAMEHVASASFSQARSSLFRSHDDTWLPPTTSHKLGLSVDGTSSRA